MRHWDALVLPCQFGWQQLEQFRRDQGIIKIHRLRAKMIAQGLNDSVSVQITQIHQCLKGSDPLGLHFTGGFLNLEFVQQILLRNQ